LLPDSVNQSAPSGPAAIPPGSLLFVGSGYSVMPGGGVVEHEDVAGVVGDAVGATVGAVVGTVLGEIVGVAVRDVVGAALGAALPVAPAVVLIPATG